MRKILVALACLAACSCSESAQPPADTDHEVVAAEFRYTSASDKFTRSFVSQAIKTYPPKGEAKDVSVIITCDRKGGSLAHANVIVGLDGNDQMGHPQNLEQQGRVALRFDNGEPVEVIHASIYQNNMPSPAADDIAASKGTGRPSFYLLGQTTSEALKSLQTMTIRIYIPQLQGRDEEFDAPVRFSDPAVTHVLKDCGIVGKP